MEIYKRVCDHCGKELDTMTEYYDTDIELPTRVFYNVDLCKKCCDDLYNIVSQFVNAQRESIEKIVDEDK